MPQFISDKAFKKLKEEDEKKGRNHLAKQNSKEYMKDVHPEPPKKKKRYRTGFERANHIPLRQPISNFSDGSKILF